MILILWLKHTRFTKILPEFLPATQEDLSTLRVSCSER